MIRLGFALVTVIAVPMAAIVFLVRLPVDLWRAVR